MLQFDFILTQDNLKEKANEICPQIKPHWLGKEINIKHISGGITNLLCACHLSTMPWNKGDTILFRIYGLNTEEFISRTDEVANMEAMRRIGLGPQIYGQFKNGICYELLSGEVLSQTDAIDEHIYPMVAEGMAKMQMSGFKGFRTSDESELDSYFIYSKLDKLCSLLKEGSWRDTCPVKDDLVSDEEWKSLPSKEEILEECKFLKNFFKKYTSERKSLLVFSHNDLLLGNIIYNKEKDSIKFIDYEYGQTNFQAYDCANHFNEFAGVEYPDYSFFPNKEFQIKWLRVYLNAFYKMVNEHYDIERHVTVTDTMVEEFYDEVQKFTSASDLIWSIWSLVQAQNSTIEFNFVKYAVIRFARYRESKQHCI